MNTPPKLAFACPMPWTTMTGTERWKYCTQCGHHVTNLSLLSAAERAALLERARTERICGSYFMRLSGEMVTPEAPLSSCERKGVKQLGVAVLSAAAMALASGCISATAPKDIPVAPQVATVALEENQSQAVPACSSSEKTKHQKDEEEIVLLTGFLVEARPEHKPGRSGK